MDERFNIKDYFCYDGPMPIDPELENMSDEEIELEFKKRFEEYLK